MKTKSQSFPNQKSIERTRKDDKLFLLPLTEETNQRFIRLFDESTSDKFNDAFNHFSSSSFSYFLFFVLAFQIIRILTVIYRRQSLMEKMLIASPQSTDLNNPE